ncbi:MAG: hypothetical protein HY903_13775 [Deltaproteobacteria bacterium]|nr:hypothetical protein [Deltaproteobacteria bacterium]
MTIRASAPGKIMLLGEYAVLAGSPALVLAVDRRVAVRGTKSGGPHWQVSAAALRLDHQAVVLPGARPAAGRAAAAGGGAAALSFVAEAITAALGEAAGAAAPLHLEIDSAPLFAAIGRKLGLGSSAAVCVATTAVVLTGAAVAVPTDVGFRDRLFATAKAAHARAQGGRGSGADVAASVWGGLLCYQLQGADPAQARAAKLSTPAWLRPLVVWVGESAPTASMVGAVARARDRDPRGYDELMRAMAGVAADGVLAAERGAAARFTARVQAYADLMAELGRWSGVDIFSARHLRAKALARRHGAIYKPAGAGGGDLGVAFLPGDAEATDLEAALAADGFEVVHCQPEAGGCEVSRT